MPYKDPQKRLECAKRWKKNNPEKVKQGNKKYLLNNPITRKNTCKKYYEKIKDTLWYKTKLKIHNTNRIQEKINIIKKYENKPCKICNKIYPLVAMDFHHRDPTQKTKDIHSLVYGYYSKDLLLKELDKCDILCSNCHFNLENQNKKYTFYPQWFLEYRSKLKCIKCGIKNPLEFHHKDKFKKITTVINMIHRPRQFSKEDILNEIKKCEVLCRCCHRVVEYL